MAATFEFVLSDPVSNPKPGKSLQIRSRCMQGKNRRDGSRRSQQEKKKKLADTTNGTAAPAEDPPNASIIPSPRSQLSGLAVVQFASPDIDLESKALIFSAFAHNIADQSISPLNRCVDFSSVDSVSFQWLFSDATFLHSILCASHAINDFMHPEWDGGKPSYKTVYHLQKTLSLLQERLRTNDVYQDESVLYIIFNLVLLASAFGDWNAAAAHFVGLRKIVGLRGDSAFLGGRPGLHYKLDRLDLAWSLSLGKKPFFLHPNVSWDTVVPAPYPFLPKGLYRPLQSWDTRLANVFQDLQHLVLGINHSQHQHARCNAIDFHHTLTCLQSRLMHLWGMLLNPFQELVRLTMLAFMSTMFIIPGGRPPYGWVIDTMRDVYTQAADELFEQDESLRLWMLITAAFTVAGAQESWVREAWRKGGWGRNWAAVKEGLTRVMWVESIHDGAGEMAFEQLEASTLCD